jgi:hypothetical protein
VRHSVYLRRYARPPAVLESAGPLANSVAIPSTAPDDVHVMHPIADLIEPVLGHSSWLVQRGHGSFVTMEFGAPEVRVGEPKLRKTYLDGAPKKTLQRHSYVDGEWHLWIYCCEWSLILDGALLAHNESGDLTMHRALHVLNGQQLTAVDIEPADGRTRFTFDLGCILITRPAPPRTYEDEPVEQWYLYLRSGPVLAVRGDGSYKVGDRHQKPADRHWLPINTPVRIQRIAATGTTR